MKLKFNHLIITIGILLISVISGNSQTLFAVVNYHPHDDKNIEKIKSDIQLMKAVGRTTGRLGHLA